MIQVGFKSDKGIRRDNNEDACFIVPSENVYIIADGVGGNNAGEIASRTAVAVVAEYIRRHPVSTVKDEGEKALKEYFLKCLTAANTEVYALARRHEENRGMATTMVVAYVDGKTGYITNIGDSRAYVCRDGELFRVTEDHTYVNELLHQGAITEEEAEHHPRRNMLTRAIGGDAVANPDFFRVELRDGDILMLCTDGLYSEVENRLAAEILMNAEDMRDAAGKLVHAANRRGGSDNITVICLKI